MATAVDRSGVIRLLRWGVFLAMAGALPVVVVPGALEGFEVTMFDERAAVPTFAAWSLPSPAVVFTMPPTDGEASMTAWAAEQLATAVYGLAVLVYYAGLASLAAGLALVGVALRRFSRTADSLAR